MCVGVHTCTYVHVCVRAGVCLIVGEDEWMLMWLCAHAKGYICTHMDSSVSVCMQVHKRP